MINKPPRAKARGILLRTVTASPCHLCFASSPRQDAGYSLSCNKFLSYKSFILFSTLFFLFISLVLYMNLKLSYISSDGIGYYAYLPATFITHDLSFKTYVDNEARNREDNLPVVKECEKEQPLCNEYIGFKPQKNGNWYNKYPVGVAMLLSPFFVVSDLYVQLSGGIRDGYSLPYQLSVVVAAIFYAQVGLAFAYLVFRRRFSKTISMLLLLILLLGTNAIHYIVYEPAMSHIYSFAFISATVFLLDTYLLKPNPKLLILMGITISLIIAIRNLNGIFAIASLVLIIKNTPSNIRLKSFLRICMIWGLALFIILIPQFIYWKISLGQFVVYSYGQESFIYLSNPQILKVLFDIQSNGVLIWHPILALTMIGNYFIIKSKDSLKPLPILLLILLYLYSSWWAYPFGYAFGYRPFMDYYIIFFIPIGYLFKYISTAYKTKRIIFIIIISLLVILNLIHLRNYWGGIVSSYNLTNDSFWNNFANPNIDIILKKLF